MMRACLSRHRRRHRLPGPMMRRAPRFGKRPAGRTAAS
ncbi:hypothetical protein CSE45_3297 [Citreicella sp. SE45]|nr:hypothetical protein CSE45_3297 [Citreicella sp. SE45]